MQKKNLARWWFLKGCRYDSIGSRRNKAIAAYRKSIKYDDKLTDAYVDLGFVYQAEKDYERAAKC